MSPAKVEGRTSIVGWCTPELVLRNSEVDPVQTVVPLLLSSSTLSHCLAMVSSHTGLRNQLWIFRLRTLQEKQHRDTVASPPTNTPTDQNCHSPEVAVSWYCFHQHTNTNRNTTRGRQMIQGCLMFQPASLCPNSWENNDARQMRMTDKETRHLSADPTKTRQTRFWQVSEPLSPKRCLRKTPLRLGFLCLSHDLTRTAGSLLDTMDPPPASSPPYVRQSKGRFARLCGACARANSNRT